MTLDTPLSELGRLGKIASVRLNRLRLKTAGDLLYYFPFRYDDFSQSVSIKSLIENASVTIKARVELIANRRSFKSRKIITEALVSDDTGSLRLVWFNQPFLTKMLHPGETVFLSGVVKTDMLGAELINPTFEKESAGVHYNTGRLVPIYSVTEHLSQKQIRALVQEVLPLANEVPDWLPEKIIEENDLVPLSSALLGIHFPDSKDHLKAATDRLKFDELFFVQLMAEQSRRRRQDEHAPMLSFHETEVKEFVSRLPFTLTKTQKIAAWEILQDIAKPQPMNRLLSGDVGSGKTVVAALAMFNSGLNGFQSALMAPTEILATQHYHSLGKLLGNKAVVALLTGSQSMLLNSQPSTRSNSVLKKEVLRNLKEGKINIVVGTHALLSKGVDFKNLGLVIVDEQHRFGVRQRQEIQEKGHNVHFLSMTATPIPRSLALMMYGDLDVSVINELPPGRKKIITRLAEPLHRAKAYAFIAEQIKKGRQAFVVCPVIESKEHLTINNEQSETAEPALGIKYQVSSINDKKSVLAEYEKLSKKIFPEFRVGYLHGKMKAPEKDAVMTNFAAGKIDILVSTSVVEVGVNIPNASVMMIEGAEKFGLAQLHQFRGRVGRSEHQSYCILFTDSDSAKVQERLKYFEAHSDGFALAEKDLSLRGPGQVYGTEQSGMQNFRLATLVDRDLIKKARSAAREIAPEIKKYPLLYKRIGEMKRGVHLE